MNLDDDVVEHLVTVRDDLKAEVDLLRRRIEALDSLLILFGANDISDAAARPAFAEMPPEPEPPLRQIVYSVLPPDGRPMNLETIVKLVAERRGATASTKSFRRSVYNALYQLSLDKRTRKHQTGWWSTIYHALTEITPIR